MAPLTLAGQISTLHTNAPADAGVVALVVAERACGRQAAGVHTVGPLRGCRPWSPLVTVDGLHIAAASSRLPASAATFVLPIVLPAG